jgi:beta-galactosidase
MKKTHFDLGWRFSLDDSAETIVNLPHDFSIGRPRKADSLMADRGGFFQGGNGVYKKKLDLPAHYKGSTVMLEVEGAYMNAEVFINGNLAAFHPYGYTSFHADLTPYLADDKDNELEIRVQNNALPNSRWYSGSGLYRPIWLLTGKESYIEPWGVFATTPVATQARSVVSVETAVCGSGLLRHKLLDPAGKAVAAAEAQAGGGKNSQELTADNVQLWSPESPTLYTLVSELVKDGQVVDAVETAIGIRSIELNKEKGFLLNGTPTKLKGGCVHHDCGILGSAAFDLAEERKVLAHKAAGYNMIRCAHNPPSPAFLDACDRHGIIVMDEAFDCWRMGKTAFDYHLYFADWWQRDISAMVKRDRNHPCIAFWSTGNEILERFGESDGYALAAELAKAVRELDSTRFVSNAMCGAWDQLHPDLEKASEPFLAPLDVSGYNYLWKYYDDHMQRYPERFILSTETIAGDAFENWSKVEQYPRVIGDCVWTSMDYIGEAGIGHSYLPDDDSRTHGLGYPWHLANCGDLDICCRPRPQSYYRQILWGHRTAPWIAVHRPNSRGLKPEFNFWGWGDVQHSWSWPEANGFKTYIDVYSACDEVELFLNGQSLGRKPAGKAVRNIASFEAVYEPGDLKAVAYTNGAAAGEDAVRTCGKPTAIALSADRLEIGSTWGGLAYVTATIVDDGGNAVPYAANELFFAASGAGELAAVGTNDPLSEEPYVGNRRSAFEGTVVAALRSTGSVGDVVLTVSASGLKAAQITLSAR